METISILKMKNFGISIEEDGNLTVLQKQGEGGAGIKHLHILENISDVGDGWEFSPLEGDTLTIPTIQNLKTSLLEATEQIGTLKMEYTISIPKGLNENNTARSEEFVDIPVQTLISLKRGNSHIIEFKTTIKNMAKNHRIRILFPTPFKADQILVNGHFGTLSRNIALPDSQQLAT